MSLFAQRAMQRQFTPIVWLLFELVAHSNILNTPEFIKPWLTKFRVLWQQKLFMGATMVFKLSNSLGHSSRMRFSACGMQVIRMALGNTLLRADPTAVFIKDILLDIRPRTQDQNSVVSLLTQDWERRNSELHKRHPISTKGTCYTPWTKDERWQLCFDHRSALLLPATYSPDEHRLAEKHALCSGMCWERQLTEFCSAWQISICFYVTEKKNQLTNGIFQGEYQLLTNNITIKITIFQSTLPHKTPSGFCWLGLTSSFPYSVYH